MSPLTYMLAIRYMLIAAVAVLLVIIIRHHDHGGVKGMPIPVGNVLCSVFAASVAATVCKLGFNRLAGWIATPFIAGIAGALGILGEFYSPYGGVVGLLVGTMVLLLPRWGPRPDSPTSPSVKN